MPAKGWWEEDPELFEVELKAFADLGVKTKVLLKKRGFLTLKAEWPVGEERVVLQVGFSPFHPYYRPSVASLDETFARHQSPIGGELCLLGQKQGHWNPTERVANFINVQFSRLRSALAERAADNWEVAEGLEESAPDPLTPYLGALCDDEHIVLYNRKTIFPAAGSGICQFLFRERQVYSRTVVELILGHAQPFGPSPSLPSVDLPPNGITPQKSHGLWLKTSPPRLKSAKEYYDFAINELKKKNSLSAVGLAAIDQAEKANNVLICVVFDDVCDYRGQETEQSCFFIRRIFDGQNQKYNLVNAGSNTSEELFTRTPFARKLRDKSIFLVGCGAIGSFVALELARAGIGDIRLLDADKVEPGNSIRWPLGRSAWGLYKATALADFIGRNYYTTAVAASVLRLGRGVTGDTMDQFRIKDAQDHFEVINSLIAKSDLVIDASASTEVQQHLASRSRLLGKDFLTGYATPGLAGGLVARYPKSSAACLDCFNLHRADGTIPPPQTDEAGVIKPAGCNELTFVGGAFDIQEIALEIVRSAVGLLADGAYDVGDWALSMLALKDEHGKRVLPRWMPYVLPRHPSCHCASA